MSKNEKEILLQECKSRDKWNYKPPMLQPKKTEKEKEILFQNTPMLYRFEESYISPNEDGWESRYYNILFNNENTENICINYLEGLNWVKNYYFEGKYCWRWKYNYSYPPLLKDLYNVLNKNSYHPKDNIITKPVKPNTQLAYVLPPIYLYLLPKKMKTIIQKKYLKYYVNDYSNEIPNLKFNWAYKRYFWESHVKLPEISNSIVNDWEKICT
jgi:5'-3' exonuclease